MGIYEGALLGLEEKHGSVPHAVCAVQFMDGERQIDGTTDLSAPANRVKALQGVKAPRRTVKPDVIAVNFSWNLIKKLTVFYPSS